ncbi:MAG: radical SAM protein [Pseudomonadota bacterium]
MPSKIKNRKIAKLGFLNYIAKKPLCVSFEVSYQCNARCKHCHLGGPIQENPAPPGKFGELCKELNPVVAQISGGEPLLRKDIFEIVKALANPVGTPMVVLTTNGKLLTKEKYYALKEAGVDEFSLSLDYPDERHDEFRNIPGLFRHVQNLLHEIKDEENKGITLACVVQSKNFRDLIRMAEFALENGVKISFSTYTWLRTNDKSWMIPREELPEFREIVDQLLVFKKKHRTVFTSKYVFKRMIKFFENERMPNCRAGERFLVVNPEGTISPCGLIIGNYKSQKDVVENFLKNNTCEACNTSIRANTEKPWNVLLMDAIRNR